VWCVHAITANFRASGPLRHRRYPAGAASLHRFRDWLTLSQARVSGQSCRTLQRDVSTSSRRKMSLGVYVGRPGSLLLPPSGAAVRTRLGVGALQQHGHPRGPVAPLGHPSRSVSRCRRAVKMSSVASALVRTGQASCNTLRLFASQHHFFATSSIRDAPQKNQLFLSARLTCLVCPRGRIHACFGAPVYMPLRYHAYPNALFPRSHKIQPG
jgi:hypothetical protein